MYCSWSHNVHQEHLFPLWAPKIHCSNNYDEEPAAPRDEEREQNNNMKPSVLGDSASTFFPPESLQQNQNTSIAIVQR
jgi:hypothetical protein